MIKVIKKDGTREEWQDSKIVNALKLANKRAKVQIKEEHYSQLCELIKKEVGNKKEITVVELHEVVQDVLKHTCLELYREYSNYRNFKKRYQEAFERAKDKSLRIVWSGDKENANKDSCLNSTKSVLIANAIMGEMMKEFEMEKEWVQQHEEGYIHIHDLSERFVNSKNCNLFNMAGVLDGGFELNGIKYEEPNNILTAFGVAGDVVISASGQQYGGFTVSEMDKVMKKYAERTYQSYKKMFLNYEMEYDKARKMAFEFTLRDIKKGYKAFEVKIGTIGNSLGQTPFTTVTFGLDTDFWGREISKAILNQRIRGIGVNKQTPIFPKLVFLYSEETCGDKTKPNQDLFDLGIKCSRTRLYPDFLKVDGDNSIGKIYNECGDPVSPMGK